jgi:hypothetical protein
MIDLARKEAPDPGFWCGSALDAPLPAAVAVTAVGEVLNYAADRRAGYAALRDLAHRVAAALVPDGLFLFDLSTPGRNAGAQLHRQRHDRDEWTLYMEAREDAAEQILDGGSRSSAAPARTGTRRRSGRRWPAGRSSWRANPAARRRAARPPSDQAAGH